MLLSFFGEGGGRGLPRERHEVSHSGQPSLFLRRARRLETGATWRVTKTQRVWRSVQGSDFEEIAEEKATGQKTKEWAISKPLPRKSIRPPARSPWPKTYLFVGKEPFSTNKLTGAQTTIQAGSMETTGHSPSYCGLPWFFGWVWWAYLQFGTCAAPAPGSKPIVASNGGSAGHGEGPRLTALVSWTKWFSPKETYQKVKLLKIWRVPCKKKYFLSTYHPDFVSLVVYSNAHLWLSFSGARARNSSCLTAAS